MRSWPLNHIQTPKPTTTPLEWNIMKLFLHRKVNSLHGKVSNLQAMVKDLQGTVNGLHGMLRTKCWMLFKCSAWYGRHVLHGLIFLAVYRQTYGQSECYMVPIIRRGIYYFFQVKQATVWHMSIWIRNRWSIDKQIVKRAQEWIILPLDLHKINKKESSVTIQTNIAKRLFQACIKPFC